MDTPLKDSRSVRNDPHDIAPRLRLAWQLDDKTVVRAGFGVFYDTLNLRLLSQVIRLRARFQATPHATGKSSSGTGHRPRFLDHAALNKRFSRGFQCTASYTLGYAYNVNDSTGDAGSSVTDSTYLKRDWGRSSSDHRHRFVFQGVWQPRSKNTALDG